MEMGFSRYQSLVALEKTGGVHQLCWGVPVQALDGTYREKICLPHGETPVQVLDDVGLLRG